MKIEDGAGSGKLVKVNTIQRLETSSATISEAARVAQDDGETYIWTSSYSASSGDEVIYIKNTSATKLLFIEKVSMSGVNAGLYEIFEVSGTAAGTTITGKNTNLTSGNIATATALGDASVTGLTIGDRIGLGRAPANSYVNINFNDTLVLGLNDAIAVTFTGTAGIVDAAVLGFYEAK